MQKIKFLALIMSALLSANFVWGAVVSGTTYNTLATNSLPSGWTGNGESGKSSGSPVYIMLVTSSNYIQTDNFCQGGFSSIKVKARKYGGPTDAQAKITVSWYDKTSGNETVLGTVTPSNTTLTDYTISSLSNPTANTEGYIKIQCKGAGSSKGSGVSQVTITYTTGSCGGGGGGGGGGGETSATYVKATSLSNLCVGAKVIIAASEYNVAMSETQNTNNRGYFAITKNGNNATWTTAATDVEEFTLGKTGDYYTFKDKSNNYIYAASSSNNYLKSQATNDANGEWTISFSDGVASIVSHGTNTRNVMQYNQSSSLFACYASASQQSLAIYVKDGDCSECTAISPTLSYTAAATIGQVLNPTLDKKGSSGAVTYSIKSGGTYASINASTGALTCSAAGTVTVQATIAAAGDYCEGTATSNTITISAPSYTVTAQSNNTELGTVSGTTSITASPKTCVGYADPAYTVAPAGKATVAQSGNTFTVSNVTADVTVTINFAALAKDTYEDHLHSNATIEKCGSYEAPSLDDATKATTGDCDVVHYHFAGWVTSTISTGTPGAPSGMITAGTNMNSNGRTYIAVWAKEE